MKFWWHSFYIYLEFNNNLNIKDFQGMRYYTEGAKITGSQKKRIMLIKIEEHFWHM